jgi:hypothetical protein
VTTANCPSCGALITFAIGSSEVVVCAQCRSIVARTDRGVEDHGKVAALIDSGSPMHVGESGRFRGQGFRITGRTQLRHEAGGTWDEWYAALDDGRWAWIAEAQGRFYVTFPVVQPAPPFEELSLGARVLGGSFVVAEIGEAALLSGEGELPWTPEPGASYRYADLSGAKQRFATLDYSDDPPKVFLGEQVPLEELGLEDAAREGTSRTKAVTLNCPRCGGALELRAPDQAQRVWCPYCGSGLDISEGKLQFFGKLAQSKIQPRIPLGASGTIDDDVYVIAGFMERAVRFDRDYFWTEYLLFHPTKGYRWLVDSDDHWSFVTPLNPGDLFDAMPSGASKFVSYQQRTYTIFQSATARVTHVIGEFYWKVAVGETVDTVDYVSPPFGISKEITRTGAKEIAYSYARYMEPREIEKAFGIDGLPRPSGVGPIQPNPHAALVKPWLIMIALLFLVAIGIAATRPSRLLLDQTFDLSTFPPSSEADAVGETGRVFFTPTMQLTGSNNVEVQAGTALDNSWLYVGVDLVDETGGRLHSAAAPLEHYFGVQDGESWSEGSQERTMYLSALGKGPHVLRVEAHWDARKLPPNLHLRVREGVFRWLYFILALIAISIFPLFALIRRSAFESRRWQESSYSPLGQPVADEEEDEEEDEE